MACRSLDDAAAADMVGAIGDAQESIGLLDRADWRRDWLGALHLIAYHDDLPGLVRGWCCRLLVEADALDHAALQRLARLTLSAAVAPAQAASWLEGVLRGGGMLLLQADGLWLALDGWLAELDSATFVALLPLLRRAFAGFQPPERRRMGEKAERLGRHVDAAAADAGDGEVDDIDRRRAERTLPVLAQILGVRLDGH
jgi:hypothetical protein